MAVAALIVAIVAALAAVGSFWYARRLDGRAKEAVTAAQQSAAAAQRSAMASEERTALETGRRHDELTPHFRVSFERSRGRLTVLLTGPSELVRLDSLTVRIRDDHPWRAEGSRLAGGPSPEQVAAQVWGPYRFIPGTGPGADSVRGIPGADPTGRVTPTGGMPVGESLPFDLEPTMPPRWSAWSVEDWARQLKPVIRLQLDCVREGWEPWSLPCEVDSIDGGTVEVP